jgi:flagellar hook capping protein FlgD
MRVRSLALALVMLALGGTRALAEPELIVRYPRGVPQVSITGNWTNSTYTVLRAPARGGVFEPITENSILCLGACYADDPTAAPGETYRYRFEITGAPIDSSGPAAESRWSFGPYLVTISPALARPVGVFAFPNPGRGATSIQLHVAGAPTDRAAQGEAGIYDLTGRRVRMLHRGPVARGLTTLHWDGRDERGDLLRGGVYMLRFTADGHPANVLIVRR